MLFRNEIQIKACYLENLEEQLEVHPLEFACKCSAPTLLCHLHIHLGKSKSNQLLLEILMVDPNEFYR